MAIDVTLTRGYATMTSTKNFTDGDSIKLGNRQYILTTTLAQINDIKLLTTEALSIGNIIAAVNGSGTAGTEYYTGTTQPADIYAELASTHVIRFYGAFPGAWVNNCIITEVTDGGTAYTVGTFQTGVGAIATTGGWVERLMTLNQVPSEVQQALKTLTKADD